MNEALKSKIEYHPRFKVYYNSRSSFISINRVIFYNHPVDRKFSWWGRGSGEAAKSGNQIQPEYETTPFPEHLLKITDIIFSCTRRRAAGWEGGESGLRRGLKNTCWKYRSLNLVILSPTRDNPGGFHLVIFKSRSTSFRNFVTAAPKDEGSWGCGEGAPERDD